MMKINGVLILAAATTMPIAAFSDTTGRPNGVAKHTGTYANVLVDGKEYNVEVDNFFNHVRCGELPDRRWIPVD
jgi:hypothetical protein